ncbi:hypothetical protein [Streptomyces sp. Act143]|uniref:hypothetical protein n=1 Tax=Streptomyces sp. Act143 TaxID=2200760 RepID=UPI0015E82998|nr:hypothetical protein [Streptomyces sp. Act143]
MNPLRALLSHHCPSPGELAHFLTLLTRLAAEHERRGLTINAKNVSAGQRS